jgi:hypothetical protein
MADPGIGTYVRYWLHYKNLASSLYKQFGAARKVQDDYEKQVIGSLQRNGMEKATIQINGGNIHVVDKREPNPLSLTKIEELLHGYYRQKGGKDETIDIMTYLRANRGHNLSKSLKQSTLSGAAAPVTSVTPAAPAALHT